MNKCEVNWTETWALTTAQLLGNNLNRNMPCMGMALLNHNINDHDSIYISMMMIDNGLMMMMRERERERERDYAHEACC